MHHWNCNSNICGQTVCKLFVGNFLVKLQTMAFQRNGWMAMCSERNLAAVSSQHLWTYSNISSVISCRRVELYFHSMLFTEMNRINLCKCGSFLHAYFTPSTIIHDGRKIVIPLLNSILKLFLQHWERARNTGHFYHKMKNGNKTIWLRPLHWAQKNHLNHLSVHLSRLNIWEE